MSEEKNNDKLPADDSHRIRIDRKQTSGKHYEAHGHTADPKKGCNPCNPDRPQPNDILERAMHFDVSAKGRKCTDCYCCLAYIIFLAAWVGVFGIAIHFGSVWALVYGRDYQKNICGTYNPVKTYRWWAPPDLKWGIDHPTNFVDKKYLYYPRLSDDLIDYAISLGTTVQKLDVLNMDIDALTNITLMGVCTNHCPVYGEIICTNDYDIDIRKECKKTNGEAWDKATHTNRETMFEACKTAKAGVAANCKGGELFFGLIKNPFYYLNKELCNSCWVSPINTTDIFYRCLEVIWTVNTKVEKCIFPANEKYDEELKKKVPLKPTDPGYILATDDRCITKETIVKDFSERPAYDNPVAELLGDTLMTLQGWLRDLVNAFLVILVCGCGAAIAMGFLWIFLLRWFTKPIVWGTIVGFLLVLFLGCVWSYLNTGWLPSPELAKFLAETFSTWGVSHPALDYIVSSLNSTGQPRGNLTVPDNLLTQTVSNSLPYDMDSVGGIDVETLWRISAVASTIVFIAGVVAVALLAKKIMIAIAIIEEAAIAIMRMPHMVFLPFGTAFCIMVLFGWFLFLGSLIKSLDEVSVGDVVAGVTGWLEDNVVTGNCNSTNVTSAAAVAVHGAVDAKAQYLADKAASYACSGVQYFGQWETQRLNDILLVFHLFCFLWTNELFQAITICTVAGAVCDWYWTRPSGPKRPLKTDCCYCLCLPCCRSHGPDPKKAYKGGDGKSFQAPIIRSFCRTMRFHLGSLALGSFMVAVVQLIRIAFEYLKRETKGWAQKNKCFQIMFKVITCVLCLFEKCLKFITKNAYIMVAMQGHAFCDSCCHAFKLLLTNLIQFVLVSCFSKVVIFLGKIFITGTSIVGAYFWLAQDPRFTEYTPKSVLDPPEAPDGITGTMVVNNKIVPVVMVALLGFSFASAFLHVYDLAIASILLCFCEDFKVHQVDDPHFPELHKEVYMPNSLRRIVLSPDEFIHMQQPLTQEQIMNMAGVDTRSDAEKELLTYDEIIEVAKKLFLKSNEFLHLHVPADQLTEKDIVDSTGGAELWAELKRPNPMYDKQFALDVSAGRAMVKKGYHDRRLDKFQPDLNHGDLIELIARAGKLHEHLEPMTQEAIVSHAAEKHGEAYAEMINETGSRQRIASISAAKNGGDPKVLPRTTDTPVQNAAGIRQQNEKKPLVTTEEEIL